MRWFAIWMMAIGLSCFPLPVALAASPSTVGELLDGGGRQLTREDILKLFAGATINGAAMGSANSTFQLRYLADGTATGKGRTPAGSTKISGTWSANDRNQYCQDLRTADGVPLQACFYYFVMGTRLYAAPTANRSAPVYERQLTRETR